MPGTELERIGELAEPADGMVYAVEAAATITIISDEDEADTAAELLSQLTAAVNAIEERRVALTKPLNDVVKQLNQAAKDAKGEMPDAAASLRNAISLYRTRQAQARDEAERQAQEETGQAVVDPGSLPAPTATSTRTSSGTVGSRTRWTFEVVDEHAFVKACSKTKAAWEEHGELVLPQAQQINARIKAGLREFPGLRIFEKADVVVR